MGDDALAEPAGRRDQPARLNHLALELQPAVLRTKFGFLPKFLDRTEVTFLRQSGPVRVRFPNYFVSGLLSIFYNPVFQVLK